MTGKPAAHTHGEWWRPMRGRDPGEAHRASTSLELLFDLCFVVAVAQAAAQLHHALAEGHLATGLVGYAMVFFAIWWAWMNFTWFASAYDPDDVPYRLLTLLQMAGVLVLAAGVPAGLTHYDFTVITIGYVIMRIALVGQWLRAAAEHPAGRSASVRYAIGVSLVQAGWIARLWLPGAAGLAGFAVLVLAEIAVPIWAEYRGQPTPWHPRHVADRYGAFIIIVLGEVVLATLAAVQLSLSQQIAAGQVLLVAGGGLLLVFSLWWIYVTGAEVQLTNLRTALVWGYGHYVCFAAVAALGAGLEVAIDTLDHHGHLSERAAAASVAVPVAVFMIVLAALHQVAHTGATGHPTLIAVGVITVSLVTLSAPVLGLGFAVLLTGVAVAATLAANLTLTAQRARRPGLR
ncbi:MAG TPA: low temperature requirement protein A [Pseudonocardiaceae bacterium]|nr:low temperature requirement protein A [Pseudonocardiaceae bacterium]